MADDPLAFALGAYHIVCVHFLLSTEGVPAPLAALTGLPEDSKIERVWESVWHSDTFNRDDIDSPDVQRGYLKHHVGPVVRRMYRNEGVQLLNWKGRVRIQQPGSNPDPYLIGFAPSFMAAACWVANGRGKPYVPWENRA